MSASVGADRLWPEVLSALQGEEASTSASVLVLGAPGAGKSRLLGHALEWAQEHRVAVRTAVAAELELGRAFGLAADLLGVSRQSLLADHPGDVHAVVDGVVERFERLALAQPVLLVVDDVQWADEESVRVLLRLARSAGLVGTPLLLAARAPLQREDLVDLRREVQRNGTVIAVDPLSTEEAYALLAELLQAEPGPRLRALAAAAAGIPLLLVELVEALRRSNALVAAEGRVDALDDRPAALQESVLSRLDRLGPAAGDVVRVASVLGTRFALADLAVVTGEDVLDLLRVLDDAAELRLLDTSAAEPQFRHDLIRRVIYDAMPTSAARSLHNRAAWALAGAGAAEDVVAAHLRLGAPAGDRRAIAWIRDAADRAAATSPHRALDLYDAARELVADDGELADELAVASLMPLVDSGRPAEAEERAGVVLRRRLAPAHRVAALSAMAAAAHLQGRPDDVLARVREGEAAAPDSASAPELRRLRAEACETTVLRGDRESGEQMAAEIAAEASAAGDDVAECLGWSALAHARWAQGYLQEAVAAAERAVAAGDRSVAGRRRNKRHVLGALLIQADRFDEAERVLREGLAENDRLGVSWSTPSLHFFLGVLQTDRGELLDGLTHLEAGLQLAAETGTRLNVLDAQLARVTQLVRLGRNDDAHAAIASIEAGGVPLPTALPRLVLALRLGRYEQVRTALARPVPPGPHIGPFRSHGVTLVKLMTAVGHRDKAADVTAHVETLAERCGVPTVRAAALRCRSLVSGDPGPAAEALPLLEQVGRRVELAEALEECGRLHEAAAAFRELGMPVDEARAAPAEGRSRAKRSPRPATGWDALTDSEARVVELVLAGLTYRETGERLFISRRTVETHVAHVFQKLGIASRRELAALAARRQ